MAEAGFALINLESGDPGFIFQFFPQSLQSSDRANWEPQETTAGVKPLFYANREPRRLDLPELWLDNTDTNETLTEDLKNLRALLDETSKGTPPALLASWGDRIERCVLVELDIEENLFTPEGYPIRAKIRISLTQLQPERVESTSVTVID